MKFARLFLATIFICIVMSSISAYVMIKFLASVVDTNQGNQSNQLSQAEVQTPAPPPLTSNIDLAGLESGVKFIASQVSPSVVSIVITKEVQTYRTDPYGFFFEPAGTIKKKVG